MARQTTLHPLRSFVSVYSLLHSVVTLRTNAVVCVQQKFIADALFLGKVCAENFAAGNDSDQAPPPASSQASRAALYVFG